MRTFQLAQLHLASVRAPLDDPARAEFAASRRHVHALADASSGLVWRLADEAGDATAALRGFGAELLVDLSVWRDLAALRAFTARSTPAECLRRRAWCDDQPGPSQVLWWVPSEHRPSLAEAAQRLSELRARGPTARAFTLRDADSLVPPTGFAA
jgi:hypothetical protein